MAETKRRSAEQPITRHPLFPAIVALWSGALFGLASLAIGTGLVERLVLATGVDSVVPMATPPLGTTMRILLALGMTVVGGIVGLIAAGRFTGVNRAGEDGGSQESDAGPAQIAAPVDVAQDAEPEAPRRRRALLSKVEDASPIEDEIVPVPGREPQILDVADFGIRTFDEADDTVPFEAKPVTAEAAPEKVDAELGQEELPAWLDSDSAWLEPKDEAAHKTAAPAGAQVFQSLLDDLSHRQVEAAQEKVLRQPAQDNGFRPLARFAQDDEHTPTAFAPTEELPSYDEAETRRIADADLDALSPVELLERLALAMRTRRAAEAAAREAEAKSAFKPLPFATTMVDAGPDDVDGAANDVGSPVVAASPAFNPTLVPAALRPVTFDHGHGDEDAPLAGYVPPRHIGLATIGGMEPSIDPDASIDTLAFPSSPFARPTSTPIPAWADAEDADAADEDEESTLQHGYASLLNLSRNAGPRPRVVCSEPLDDEPRDAVSTSNVPEAASPVSIVPEDTRAATPFVRPVLAPSPSGDAATSEEADTLLGQRPFDAPQRGDVDQTEKALRAALATLQRMSGAA